MEPQCNLYVQRDPAGAHFHLTVSGMLGEEKGNVEYSTTNSKGKTVEDGPFEFAEVKTYAVTTHSNVLDQNRPASLDSVDCGSKTDASEPKL